MGKKEEWQGKARKVTLKQGSHQPGWKREVERSFNLSKEEEERPTWSNRFLKQALRFLKQALRLMVEMFKSLKEEEADLCGAQRC